MAAAIGIQIGIGTEIDEKARNATPIAIAISISTGRMCPKLELLHALDCGLVRQAGFVYTISSRVHT